MPDDSIEVGDIVKVYGHEWNVVEIDSAHGGDLVIERFADGHEHRLTRHRLLVPPCDVIRVRPPVEVRIPIDAARDFLNNPTVQQMAQMTVDYPSVAAVRQAIGDALKALEAS